MKKRSSLLAPKPRHDPPLTGRFPRDIFSRPFWTSVLLAIVTLIVYWPAVGFDFVTYDDPQFITTNPHVLGGLTWENVQWAFGTGLDGNWIPLNWLSYMLDVEWSGPTASGFHLTNVLLHVTNTVLVFLLFRTLTGAHWRSVVLACLFGLHPLHVESVAWVAERKDVLSTLFWLLAIWMYVRYVRKQAAVFLSGEYFLALIFFVSGLMSKPMVVTLPFVLLLLDYWPLRRFGDGKGFIDRAGLRRLLYEKIPFFAAAVIVSALTIFFQAQGRGVASLTGLPIGVRISNALIAYARYLEKTFWPVELANPYPLVWHWPWSELLAAGALVIGLSIWAVLAMRKQPYGLAGWLWFLGTMIPVIGLVQVGAQSMADRYTYIPLLGVFWIVVWAVADCVGGWRLSGKVVGLAALFVLGACAMQTRVQLNYWQDGESLFRHTIAVTKNNFIAYDGLGKALENKGQLDEAAFYYLRTLELRPGYEDALKNLVGVLACLNPANNPQGPALQTSADFANAHNTLGMGLAMNGRLDDAILHFRKAVFYDSNDLNARSNLGYALSLKGELQQAIEQCEYILSLSPDHPAANNVMGSALLKQKKWAEAAAHLRNALQYQPENAETHFELGKALAALGQRDEAIAHFKEALRLAPLYEDARIQLNKLENSSK